MIYRQIAGNLPVMAQARIERKNKFTVLLSNDENDMLNALCEYEGGVPAAALFRQLVRREYERHVPPGKILPKPTKTKRK